MKHVDPIIECSREIAASEVCCGVGKFEWRVEKIERTLRKWALMMSTLDVERMAITDAEEKYARAVADHRRERKEIESGK